MCFDLDSRPPIRPIAGGALDTERRVLIAADGTRVAAFVARASAPTGAGVVILPDVRGLHPYYEELALRFAEHGIDALAIDWFGRTAGLTARGDDFEYDPHA
jgi:carboxymethylenebutenolidase